MERNKRLDLVRGYSILLIVIYHIFAVTGININIPVINRIIIFGGEIGVTLFFMISGFGIYCYLENHESISYKNFVLGRLEKLLPKYYLSIFIALVLTGSIAFLNDEFFFQIFTHFFMIHNFFPSTHGSINGVLWTMGTTIQFYLLSFYIYKLIRHHPVLYTFFSIIITVLFKMLLFTCISKLGYSEGIYFFIYGRQLISALDNFVIGMLIASIQKKSMDGTISVANNLLNVTKIGSLIILIMWIYISNSFNIYSNSGIGYVWHSITAVLLGFFVFFFIYERYIVKKLFIIKIGLWISKHEYSIYLWHLLIIRNLVNNSSRIAVWIGNGNVLLIYCWLLFASLVGSYILENLSWRRG